jgi:hypothetical protein
MSPFWKSRQKRLSEQTRMVMIEAKVPYTGEHASLARFFNGEGYVWQGTLNGKTVFESTPTVGQLLGWDGHASEDLDREAEASFRDFLIEQGICGYIGRNQIRLVDDMQKRAVKKGLNLTDRELGSGLARIYVDPWLTKGTLKGKVTPDQFPVDKIHKAIVKAALKVVEPPSQAAPIKTSKEPAPLRSSKHNDPAGLNGALKCQECGALNNKGKLTCMRCRKALFREHDQDEDGIDDEIQAQERKIMRAVQQGERPLPYPRLPPAAASSSSPVLRHAVIWHAYRHNTTIEGGTDAPTAVLIREYAAADEELIENREHWEQRDLELRLKALDLAP